MEVLQNTMQYLQCSNCQKLLGEGSLICELYHSLCTSCASEGDLCRTCNRYASDMKSFTSYLRVNNELSGILKTCFARCKNQGCKHLFPLSKYEYHINQCTNMPTTVSCTLGCGEITDRLGAHLIKTHGILREQGLEEGCLKIYATTNDWASSEWKETALYLTPTICVLLSPKNEKDVFTLAIYNLSAAQLAVRVKASRGWSVFRFEGILPFFEEKVVKTQDFTFWNCEINTLKKSLIEVDETGRMFLKVSITVK